MKVYQYHPVTKEYLGESIADKSPLEPGVWLIPGSAVTTPPPAVEANKKPVWNGSGWDIVDDYRGTIIYDSETGTPSQIEALSVLPDITTPPPVEHVKPKYRNNAWIETQTEREKAMAELSNSDSRMPRISEDAIRALIAKGILSRADFDPAALEVLDSRDVLRKKLK